MENLFDLLNSSASEVMCNCRTKYKKLSDGSLQPVEIMVCDRLIFNPCGARLSELSRNIDDRLAYEAAARELINGELPASGSYVPLPTPPEEKLARSMRRAKAAVNDIIMANDFDCFVTLTLDKKKIDREDYDAIMRRLNVFLDNRVRRRGLRYVGVPERHKNGGFHFHFLCNADALALVDSGTVSCKGHKKPIKISTADRLHIPASDRHAVYNVSDWSLGFSTAIHTYGCAAAVANYVGKYITKGAKKIGGRWYYSGGKLERLVCRYDSVSFDSFSGYSYDFSCDGGHFKILKFDL